MKAKKEDRLLTLLIFVGYCIEFPKQLSGRIGGNPEWNRHVMYRAIKEGYVSLFRREENRYVIRSLTLTQKGLDYIAERDPEALAMIYSRTSTAEKLSPSKSNRILRLHSIASGMVMAHAAGAVIPPLKKPLLIRPDHLTAAVTPDADTAYYYSPYELREALEEAGEQTMVKGNRIIGIIVKGRTCYCMYDTRRSRMFWMRLTEENSAAAIQTLLNLRGFQVRTISQIIIGNSMPVAQQLCRSASPFGDRYYVVSPFYDKCHFITNNAEGDKLLSLIINPEKARTVNLAALSDYKPPRMTTRAYDAVDTNENRPVLLNYECDLLPLSMIDLPPHGFDGGYIMLCYDYQAQTLQNIVGPAVEVRPIERSGSSAT